MNRSFDKLVALLKELFQLDRPDLDFGFYRIMHAKSAEVTEFLEQDLLPQVQAALSQYRSADKATIERDLDETVRRIRSDRADPDTSPKVRELRKRLAEEAIDLGALEAEVYDHLYAFFRRYYSEGDFLSKRVYKPGVYAIPYEGEEVKLHWANADQYYIKTGEYLRDYAFRLRPEDAEDPMRVHFRLVDAAEGEHGNVKAAEGKKRVFLLRKADFIAEEDSGQGQGQGRKELVIRFEYRPATHPVGDAIFVAGLDNGAYVLDCFAGSGTTGHAVVNPNREDGGRRKFILVEMGDYFDTVLLPRIKKVVFAPEWKDGRPKRPATPEEAQRSPRIVKVVRLESYEDTLNNLEPRRTAKQQSALDTSRRQGRDDFREQYLLRYMLDVETRGNPSLLDAAAFTDPTSYRLKVKRPGSDESREVDVDLPETFNWLIGFTVRRITAPRTFGADFRRDGEGRLRLKGRLKQKEGGAWWFRTVTGTTPDGRRALVVWRKRPGGETPEGTERDNLVLDEWFTGHRGFADEDSRGGGGVRSGLRQRRQQPGEPQDPGRHLEGAPHRRSLPSADVRAGGRLMAPMPSDRCHRDSLRGGARRHRPVTPILERGVPGNGMSRRDTGVPPAWTTLVGLRPTAGETPAFPNTWIPACAGMTMVGGTPASPGTRRSQEVRPVAPLMPRWFEAKLGWISGEG